jgi:hypothetical protein
MRSSVNTLVAGLAFVAAFAFVAVLLVSMF